MYISCTGITREGIFCQKIDVELDLSRGLFSFSIVGLADKCIGESKERIVSAIKNSGFDSPKTINHKIIVSLVPAGIKKEGVLLDLPISIAYLSTVKRVAKESLTNSIFVGELGLDGSIKQNDSLALIVNLITPKDNKREGDGENKHINLYSNFNDEQINLINRLNLKNINIFNFKNLHDLVCFLNKNSEQRSERVSKKDSETTPLKTETEFAGRTDDIGDIGRVDDINNIEYEIDKIIGQEKAKRAILISICGNYHLIMSGPPGVGKTMLAKSMHQLLPPQKTEEYLEILSIHNSLERPFRAPHHTSSYTAIVGGGTPISAGEITKAHKGILFLDELPEFNKNVIESLRQPLEEKIVQINRTGDTITLPCDVICVCAMNLCSCGNRGIPNKVCRCIGNKIDIYRQKVSQPFLERFHIAINLPYEKKVVWGEGLQSLCINKNNMLLGKNMKEIIVIFKNMRAFFKWPENETKILYQESEKRGFSMRAIKHIKDISETICSIEKIQESIFNIKDSKFNCKEKLELVIKTKHLIEAFSYKENLLD